MSQIKIGTHSGTFHCDEALACYMLKLLPKYADAEIVRSRDPKVLNELPIIVDVGATYEPEKGRFDHHQKGFFQTFNEKYETKLSSAGLVYKHFGEQIIREITSDIGESDVQIIYDKVYKNFVEALDGIDNGISQYPADIKPKYSIRTDLSSRVGKLNPDWNETGIDIQARFHQGMEMAGQEFVQAVQFYAKSWLPARQLVKDALDDRKTHHDTGEIMVLKNHTIWKSHLLALEEEQKIEGKVKYVLYQDQSKNWRVQCVPEKADSFLSRVPLHEPWRGVRDEELSKVSGIDGCIFVHASGFIGGNKTFEGAMQMAKTSLEKAKGEEPPKRQKTDA